MIARLAFITLLGGAAMAWPLAASAQQLKVAQIGVLVLTNADGQSLTRSPEEDNEASELYEAEEVLGVVFPTDEDAAAAIESKQGSAPRASITYSGLAVADLAWAGRDVCPRPVLRR